MHVCHFCETSVEGRYFRNITKGLVSRGVQVSLLELGPYKPPSWLGEVSGVKYSSLGISNRRQYPIAVWKLARLLKREKIDILQTHLYFAGLIGVMAKYLRPSVLVALTRHHTSIVRMLGTWLPIAADKWMAEKADRVVTVSDAAKRFMTDVDHIRRSDIEVVYLGFDFDEFNTDTLARERVRWELGVAPDEIVIGYVANFPEGKGHVELLKAFSQIIEQVPNAKLLFVGDGDRSRIERTIVDLGIGEGVILAGWRDDNVACMNAMDIFVLPSLSEAFSQVLVEAMAVGLPVIATRVGIAEEVIADGVNGILIEPGLPDAIAEKVLLLISDPELRKGLALRGQASVRESFGVERMVNRQMEIYNQWFNQRR